MSDAKDPKKAEAKAPDPPAPAGGGKLLAILVGVNSLLLVGVMAFLFLQMRQQTQLAASAHSGSKVEKGDGAKEEAEHEEKSEEKSEEKHGEGGEGSKEGHTGGGDSVGGKIGPLVKVADFVIHLRNPDADRYARMSFDVEVFNEADKERLTAQLPKVRDAFITYLSDRTLEDLRGGEGLGRTKDTLQTTLRQLLPDTRIRAVYISDFVVQ
jgi:flagellar protein FliL